MNAAPQQNEILSWKVLPARLAPEKVAQILGFSLYEITVSMRHGLLKPLGKPAPNAHKYFCASEILGLSYDREWLDKATRVIGKHLAGQESKREGTKARDSFDLNHPPRPDCLSTNLLAASFSYSSRLGNFILAFFAYALVTALLQCPRFSWANRSG